jgi:hypothetical protein
MWSVVSLRLRYISIGAERRYVLNNFEIMTAPEQGKPAARGPARVAHSAEVPGAYLPFAARYILDFVN